MDKIRVVGARLHNLKDLNVEIPKKKIVLITGISGSGKSSLAFDIIFDEGMNCSSGATDNSRIQSSFNSWDKN